MWLNYTSSVLSFLFKMKPVPKYLFFLPLLQNTLPCISLIFCSLFVLFPLCYCYSCFICSLLLLLFFSPPELLTLLLPFYISSATVVALPSFRSCLNPLTLFLSLPYLLFYFFFSRLV